MTAGRDINRSKPDDLAELAYRLPDGNRRHGNLVTGRDILTGNKVKVGKRCFCRHCPGSDQHIVLGMQTKHRGREHHKFRLLRWPPVWTAPAGHCNLDGAWMMIILPARMSRKSGIGRVV